jgi:hypothetical protein
MTAPILVSGRTINKNHVRPKKSMGAILVQHFGPFLQWTKINTSIARKLKNEVQSKKLITQILRDSLGSEIIIHLAKKSGIKKDE